MMNGGHRSSGDGRPCPCGGHGGAASLERSGQLSEKAGGGMASPPAVNSGGPGISAIRRADSRTFVDKLVNKY